MRIFELRIIRIKYKWRQCAEKVNKYWQKMRDWRRKFKT